MNILFQIVYALAGDEGDFAIDANGIVTVTRSLDREVTASYDLVVSALDRGQPQNRADYQLNFDLIDVNDVTPTFEQVCTVI